jgi:Pentapeptide repeats (8 copies)
VELRADCSRCVGLCCAGPAFAASADFAIDKPAGQPCPNLRADFRCGIHDRLRESGFPGCTAYDCFGAGQRVTAAFAGTTWRDPAVAPRMFAAYAVARDLHELLWYLTQARDLAPALDLDEVFARTERLASTVDATAAEVAAHRDDVRTLLRRTSEAVRDPAGPDYAGADLIGRRLRGADLRRADLRGAYLIGADLRAADLGLADLIGADLRGADLRGADLGTAIFVTRPQIGSANGDARTVLPPMLEHPSHWA